MGSVRRTIGITTAANSIRALFDVGLWLDLGALALALAIWFVPAPPGWVEAHYANGLYPPIDRTVRALTQPLPFSVGDVLVTLALVAFTGWSIASLRRLPRRGRVARLGALARRTLALLAAILVWFEAAWAYNYGRVPLADKIPVHPERTNRRAVTELANHVVAQLDADARGAHAERLGDAEAALRLLPTFTAAIRRLGDDATFPPPRVKPTIFQPLMAASGTSGFTDPWTHEVNLDATAFFFERPALFAHEWAHIAGFADETEANLISVLACTNAPDALLRYSGWLLVWLNLPARLQVTHPLSRQVSADIEAIRRRYRRQVNPSVARAQQAAYDRYLKANRVAAGYASYGLFVRWLTGADFDRNGLPLVRPTAAR